MARNQEKAQSMLHRFLEAQKRQLGVNKLKLKRPVTVGSCFRLDDAKKWRLDVIKDINRNMAKVHDATLDDLVIRDCNDEINRLFEEKTLWELRIKELGGPNFLAVAQELDSSGVQVPGSIGGYKYFGRAKDLPEIKEMFEEAREELKLESIEKTREQLLEAVNKMEYFGFLDDSNVELAEYEQSIAASL